ncbi:MAG: flavin reductase family protein [Rhodospirillales bacterium]|nr:flavin reductase family protein [Rhodospirillales bacterium]
MRDLPIGKAFTLIERGPVVLVATHDGAHDNIMTISWTMVLDFAGTFALCTGPWNHSYAALTATRECVLAIPTIDLLDKVVGIGTCSGADTDKFDTFRLTRAKARHVRPPLVRECLANLECRVRDVVRAHNIVVLETLSAHIDPARRERRLIHAIGDGTFVVDGRRFDRRDMMRSKLPPGV